MFEILTEYGIHEAIVKAMTVPYTDTTVQIVTEFGSTDFKIEAGVQQGDTRTP